MSETGLRPDLSWLGVLEHHARRTPTKPIAVMGDETVTYARMVEWSATVAGGLAARGVGAGDVVGLLSYNSIEFLATIFAANHLGAVNGIRAAVPVMRAQQSGSIILTASISGLTAWSHAAPYCATKAAVIQLAKVAAVEYAREGIRVNCVCPGTFLSSIHEGLPQEAIDAMASRHPLGLGSPADLVGMYSYLASDASRWTTGSAMVVDGGYSAP